MNTICASGLNAAPGSHHILYDRTKVKARVETAYGEWVERIPAWAKWATQVLS